MQPATTDHGTDASLGALVVREMRTLYGAKFTQQWQGLTPRELREAWDRHLSGMTPAEVRAGLVACLSREWPPTLPEFTRLCRPWMDPEVAFYLAVKGMSERRAGRLGDWPHPAVYWAAVSIGAHELANSGYKALEARWEHALSGQMAKRSWDPVPEPAAALPAPGQTMATRQEAERFMAQARAAAPSSQKRRDPRAWARRILDEASRKGGRSFTPAVIGLAKSAVEAEVEAE